jgi:hypothetical protein
MAILSLQNALRVCNISSLLAAEVVDIQERAAAAQGR